MAPKKDTPPPKKNKKHKKTNKKTPQKCLNPSENNKEINE